MTEQRKAKRRLSNFDFSQEGSHLALVHKDQGGAANGYNTLIMKSTGKYSEEFVQKVAQVQVTLTFEEFLSKFFDMWYTDAKVLATMLGMQDEEDEDEGDWYKNHVADQVAKFEIMKSAHEAENKIDFLANLTEDDYLGILQAQEKFEKALEPKATSGGKKPVKKTEKSKAQVIANKADTAVTKEDKPMPDSAKPELIEKAQLDEIQKSYNSALEELKKANEAIETYKAKELEAVAKARKDTLFGAIEAEAEAKKLLKAVGDLPEDSFQAVVEVVKALATKVDASALFVEQGSPTEGEQVQKSALRAQIEKQLAKDKQ